MGSLEVFTSGLLFFILLSSCSNYRTKRKALENLGQDYFFSPAQFQSSSFNIFTLQSLKSDFAPISIYIEGDGAAFKRYSVSKNPTPSSGLVPALMLKDPSPNKVYLARPCQYINLSKDPHCNPKVWSIERFSEKAVKALSSVIDKVKLRASQKINLIGYSGGGAMAILIGAQRSDVLSIRTIAGTLSSDKLMSLTEVSPLVGSLDPINFTHKLIAIPQIHFYGNDDSIIPEWVSEDFVQKSSSSCVKRKLVEGADHSDGWLESWEELLELEPSC